MIRIRTKLLVFLLVIVLVMNGIAYLLYQNGQQSVDQYNRLSNRFFLLNEVSQKTTAVYQSLHAYLVEQTPKLYQKYLNDRKALKQVQEKLPVLANADNHLMIENYSNMITSYLEECAIVSGAFQTQNANRYSSQLTDAKQTSRFIRETTLNLLNDELTKDQGFYHQVSKKGAYFHSMGMFVFISTFLLIALFVLWFSRGITRPIERLTNAATEISTGKFDGQPVEVSTKDELRFLTNTFNNMRTNIHELVGEIKQQSELDKLLKDMELKSLQSQVNPHFLFNILNTVSKTAYLEGAERTSQLVDSTAALLRHNLSRLDQPTTLGKEVEIIREYFFLQKARFGERVAFKTDIDASCLHVTIPCMTLQPIVENAFIHGIESYEEGAEILLRIQGEDPHVIVEVADNGVGMDEEMKRRLLDPDEEIGKTESKGHSTGLGLKNVMKRMALFYNQDQLVDIASTPGGGTKVKLTIPVREGGSHV